MLKPLTSGNSAWESRLTCSTIPLPHFSSAFRITRPLPSCQLKNSCSEFTLTAAFIRALWNRYLISYIHWAYSLSSFTSWDFTILYFSVLLSVKHYILSLFFTFIVKDSFAFYNKKTAPTFPIIEKKDRAVNLSSESLLTLFFQLFFSDFCPNFENRHLKPA